MQFTFDLTEGYFQYQRTDSGTSVTSNTLWSYW